MSKELMEKLKWKKKFYRMWKRGLPTCWEYRSIFMACRDAKRKAKAHWEFNLAKEVKDNQKGVF